jgi:hypothetical protein
MPISVSALCMSISSYITRIAQSMPAFGNEGAYAGLALGRLREPDDGGKMRRIFVMFSPLFELAIATDEWRNRFAAERSPWASSCSGAPWLLLDPLNFHATIASVRS